MSTERKAIAKSILQEAAQDLGKGLEILQHLLDGWDGTVDSAILADMLRVTLAMSSASENLISARPFIRTD